MYYYNRVEFIGSGMQIWPSFGLYGSGEGNERTWNLRATKMATKKLTILHPLRY